VYRVGTHKAKGQHSRYIGGSSSHTTNVRHENSMKNNSEFSGKKLTYENENNPSKWNAIIWYIKTHVSLPIQGNIYKMHAQ